MSHVCNHDQGREEIQHRTAGLERGVLHQLSPRFRQQCRPGTGLDPRGVQEDRREVRLPALHPRERLVSALHPQPRQPDPLRRLVPAHPRSGGHPQDPAPGRDARTARRRLHDGALPGRHLPDDRTEGQEDRPLEEPEHHQERLVAHPGGAGHRADAPDERHDPRRRARSWSSPTRTTGTTIPRCWTRWRTHRNCGSSATTSTTWPSVRWRPRWKRASSMRSTPRASPSSISRRRRASSRRSRTCPGIRTGPCRWPTSPPPSPAPT